MERKTNHSELVFGGIFLLILAVSLVFYLVIHHPPTRRVLFFPELSGRGLAGEERWLPSRRGLEENVQLLVDEIILGPARPEFRRLVPRRTQLLSVLLRDDVLYLNLSRELLSPERDMQGTPAEMIQGLVNTVRFNFPRIRRLVVFVDGQVPRFAEDGGGEIGYNPSLLQ